MKLKRQGSEISKCVEKSHHFGPKWYKFRNFLEKFHNFYGKCHYFGKTNFKLSAAPQDLPRIVTVLKRRATLTKILPLCRETYFLFLGKRWELFGNFWRYFSRDLPNFWKLLLRGLEKISLKNNKFSQCRFLF